MTATTPIPLTTTFSPPASCTTDTWFLEYLDSTYLYSTVISATSAEWCLSQGPEDWSSCFPSGYSPSTDFYYSPGVCPSGYTIATQSIASLDGNSETQAACCPSGYSAQTEDDKDWYTTNRCTSFNADQNHVWTVTKAGTVSTMTSADGSNARAVFIRWQSSDLATATATSADSSVSSSTTHSTASNKSLGSVASQTATSQAGTSTKGKSSNAWIAGPVIAAVFGCTLIVFAAVWYTRRKYKSKRVEAFAQRRELPGDRPPVVEAPSYTWFPPKKPIAELSTTRVVSEMP